jgi:threonine dehydratase
MDEKKYPSLAEIHVAASHLHSISIPITPILINTTLNKLTGRNVYVKCENFQQTGSFRSRGALNAILNSMKIDPNVKGFVTYSSDNHGIAVAYAASLAQRPCVVVITDATPKYNIEAIKQYGAELVTSQSTLSNRIEACSQISKERGFLIISTSDHSDVIAGN